jgi:hypothetical protein
LPHLKFRQGLFLGFLGTFWASISADKDGMSLASMAGAKRGEVVIGGMLRE